MNSIAPNIRQLTEMLWLEKNWK